MNTNVLQKYNRKESKVKKKIELNYFIFFLLIKTYSKENLNSNLCCKFMPDRPLQLWRITSISTKKVCGLWFVVYRLMKNLPQD